MMSSYRRTEQLHQDAGSARRLPRKDPTGLQPVIRIGVTGHRDLADRKQAHTVTAEALCRLLTMLETVNRPPGTIRSAAHSAVRVGYRVISPLAEGADRVVAELILSSDARLRDRTRELVVPLPFGLDYYRGRDCGSPQSQAEFDRLRSAALWTRALHPLAPVSPEQRDTWYRDVGSYVVEHCDFLFALWDGMEGGTAAVVGLALDRGTPVIWIPVTREQRTRPALSLPDGSEPLLLTTPWAGDPAGAPRLSSPQAEAAILGRRKAPASDLLLERLRRLAELRRHAERSRPVQESIDTTITAAASAPPAHAAVVQSVADWIIPVYVIADGLALRNQRVLKILNIGVYAAASIAVTLGAFVAILFPDRRNWLLLEVFEAIVLVALFLVQALDIRRKRRDQWITFRALSEYFRIGRFLALVTPAAARSLEFDRFARLHSWSSGPVSVPWFAPVIERVWERRPDLDLGDSDVPWLRSYLAGQWVDGQISYYESRAKIHHRWDMIFRWAIWVTLLATVVIVITHVILDYLATDAAAHRNVLSLSLAFTAIALTSLAGALNGYSGQQRHNHHSARIRHTKDELEAIRKSICETTTIEKLRARLREVRRITLGETTDWYQDMEQQEIDSPA